MNDIPQSQALLKRISAAFAQTTMPREIIRDECASIPEAQDIRAAFQSRKWEEIEVPAMTSNKAAFGYFTEEAAAYFLPAFLRLVIVDIEEADVLATSLLNYLTLPSAMDTLQAQRQYLQDDRRIAGLDAYFEAELMAADENIHRFIRFAAMLSEDQSRCVLDFLEYLEMHHAPYFEDDRIHVAIFRYWFQFA